MLNKFDVTNVNLIKVCLKTLIDFLISTVKVWPKSQKWRFWGKIRHGYGLFWSQSIGSCQGYYRYRAAMLGSVLVGASMFWLVPLVPAPSPGRSVLLRAGTGPVILCIYRKVPFGAGFAERLQELLYHKVAPAKHCDYQTLVWWRLPNLK